MAASIKDIAKALGMSVSTVSLALNDKPRVSPETRKLVKDKAKELNYMKNGMAADLKRRHTKLVLFICNDASRSFFAAIINQLQKATSYFGYDFLISTTYGDHTETARRMIREHRADTAIIYTSTIDDAFINEHAHEDFPIVVLGRKVEGNNEHVYCYPYQEDVRTMVTTDYLISQGHRKIAFVKGSRVSLGTLRTTRMYKQSLEDNGIPYDESLVFDAEGASYDHGYKATEKLLPLLNEITAIQYSTDDIAIGGMMCLMENGIRIPEDISIVGYNNIKESKFIFPALTTAGGDKNSYLFYESIIHYLIMLIEKKEEYDNVAVQLSKYLASYSDKHHLIIRGTVKKVI